MFSSSESISWLAGMSQLLTRENGLELGKRPTLLMEFHAAHEGTIEKDLHLVREICQEMEAQTFYATADSTERGRIWHARHHLFETIIRSYPGNKWISMDVAVPISAYPELVAYANQQIAELDLFGVL